jgi:salicylate hydroxylase
MKKISIIGGGISGLYLANLLNQNSDYEIIIYEKNNSVNLEKGYGIQLSVNSTKLLNQIGFQSVDFKNKFYPSKIDFYSLKNKKKICDLDIAFFNDSQVKYTTLERSTLINFLKERLPANLINYNKKVLKVNYDSQRPEIIFEDSSSASCDYLIISDGVFSKTRSLITTKEVKPKYFNSIAIRATTNQNNLQEINHNNISLFLGSNLHSVVYPVDQNGQFNFVTIFRKNISNIELIDNTLFKSKDFISSILLEISKQVDSNIIKNLKNIKCFPVFVSSKIIQPKNRNIFLIGDAFFTFPPTFAQGASQSIETANELFKNFENDITQFNDTRIKRTKMIDRKSKFNYFIFHISNPLICFLRNILMKHLVRNNRFINSYLGKIYKN